MTLERPYALSKHEVTRGEYSRFIADSGYEPQSGCRVWDPALSRFSDDGRRGWQDTATPAAPADEVPVSCVSFADAEAYAGWLSTKTGSRYRLPSEAEWEYAARAGSRTLRPWGDDAESGCDFANTYDLVAAARYRLGWTQAGCRDGFADLAPVGQFGANAFGLHDMIGNVREWVQDCATGSYVGRPRDARAWEWLGGCEERVQRGGSWITPPAESRSAYRAAAPAAERVERNGLPRRRSTSNRRSGTTDEARASRLLPCARDSGRLRAGRAVRTGRRSAGLRRLPGARTRAARTIHDGFRAGRA